MRCYHGTSTPLYVSGRRLNNAGKNEMPDDVQQLKHALDQLFYLLGAYGVFQLGRAGIVYLLRYRVKRGEDDDTKLRADLDRLRADHNRCPVKTIDTRLATVESEVKYIRRRIDTHLNGAGRN